MTRNQLASTAPVGKYIENNFQLLLIFLLGLFLRICYLGAESMWLDEIFSVEMSHLNPINIVKENMLQGDSNPPLYYVLLHYWVIMFGDSEFASRMLSVIPGSLSVLLIYKFGRELFNKNAGLIAALIMAVSVFQIKYSQEARTYSLIVFLTLFSNYLFLRLLSGYRYKYVLGYVFITAALIYAHYYWVFYVMAQNVYVFTKLILNPRGEWPGFKRWIAVQFILVVVWLPEFILLKGADAMHEGFWRARPDIHTVIDTILQFSGSLQLLILFFVLSAFTVVSAVGANFKSGPKETVNRAGSLPQDSPFSNTIDRVYFLIVLLFTPIIFAFIISRVFNPIYGDRYLIGASPALYVLIAAGIDNLGFKKLQVFAVILIVCLSLLGIYRYYLSADKHQWREAVYYIEENASPGDLIMVSPDFELRSLEYYLKRNDLGAVELSRQSNLDFGLKNGKAWVVCPDHSGQDAPVDEDSLKQYNKILSEKNYNKVKIYLLTGKSD